MKISSLVLSLLILSAFTFAPKATKLQYEFKMGDQYEWVQSSTQIFKQSIMGMDQIVERKDKATLTLKVKTLTANGALLEATYNSMGMIMKLPVGMGEQNLDSEGDQEKVENKFMKSLMNKPFTITLTKSGAIENIEGEENLLSDLSSVGLSEQQMVAIKSTIGQNLNDESLKASFQMVMVNYPEKALKTGETWTNKVGAPASFPIQTNNTWSFGNILSEVANLTATGVITTTDKEKIVTLPNGIKTKFDLGGTQNIASSVNAKSGWPVIVKVSSEIKGNMNFIAGGMIPQDMQIPMTVSITSDYNITKK